LPALVNLFLKSTGLDFVISAAGVLIFAGLTAWDTQRITSPPRKSQGQTQSGMASLPNRYCSGGASEVGDSRSVRGLRRQVTRDKLRDEADVHSESRGAAI
jgi:hypothetical protein